MGEKIERTLGAFGVPAQVVQIERGPTVTRFGLQPGTIERGGRQQRVKVSRITSLKDDLALALAARSLRIEAPVPGRPMIGIEIPNPETHLVGLRGLLEGAAFRRAGKDSRLTLALGRDVSGQAVVADLTAMPHLLIAGATGSGKSVCLHTVIASLLFQNTPDTLRLVLVDPKRVEFSRYGRLPHLVGKVVTEIPDLLGALKWAAGRMDHRYRLFAERRVRDLASYNARSPAGEAPLPVLAIVIDELADPMLIAPEDTEPLIMRLAQLGRATGIHLVVATQRPSTDVVTGVIKANFPARIAFAVASGTDSRVILDNTGAESLLGRGDMLFQAPDASRPRRAQGTFVADEDLNRLVAFWEGSTWSVASGTSPWADLVEPLDAEERLFQSAIALAEQSPRVNASLLQRRLRIGYRKARDLMDRLEQEGFVDSSDAEGGRGAAADADLDWVDDEFEG
jgi:S-DNA-T family DNA segregation ATPase FtsK/SpoIIIE